MNGYKLIQDGVVSPMVTEKEEKQLKRIEKEQAKIKKKEEKAEDKALEDAYKAKIKEMEAEFKEMQDDYNLRQRINGSTSGNEAVQKYNEIKAQQEEARQKALEKQKAKELRELEKQRLKEERQNRNN